MRNALRTLRYSTVWGMIPLAIWAGLPATSCFCADGGFKMFCGGHVATATHAVTGGPSADGADKQSGVNGNAGHCPACGAKQPAASDGAKLAASCPPAVTDASCCQKDASPDHQTAERGAPTSCCRLTVPASFTAPQVVALSDLAALEVPCLVEIVAAPRLAAAALARSYDVFETGPPVDRVIVLCSLRI